MYNFSAHIIFSCLRSLARSSSFAWDFIHCLLHLASDFVSVKSQLMCQTLSQDFVILSVLPSAHMSFRGINYVLLCTNSKTTIILFTVAVLLITD